MKKIEAVITPFALDGMRDALMRAGADGMTVTEVRVPELRGRVAAYRGVQYATFQPRVKVEVVIRNDQVLDCVDVIRAQCRRAPGAEVEIAICPLDGGVRIRTGEQLSPNLEKEAVLVPRERGEVARESPRRAQLTERTGA